MKLFNLCFLIFIIICSCSSIHIKQTKILNCTKERAEKIAIGKVVKLYRKTNIDSLYLKIVRSETDSTFNFYYCPNVAIKGGDV